MPTDAVPRSLVLAPFRGLRFDPHQVGDLGTVVSPPYDVLDAETVRELEAGNRRNIVRLILARQHQRPYLAVRDRLESWRDQRVLVPDPEPALYVYEYVVDGVTVRGLVGVVGLREPADGVVLPHEDVMPAPVEDRTLLMRTTRTNLEPILLVHEGSPEQRDVLERAAQTAPVAAFQTRDGSRHRLWRLADPALLAAVSAQLRDGSALIADGHHRYAAYLRLREEMRDPADPPGGSAWDYGLAMLVDQHDYPLGIGPIHRSVAALTLTDVLDLSVVRGDRLLHHSSRDGALAAQEDAHDTEVAVFVVSDGHSWLVLETPRTHEVDAAVLHQQLFPAWEVAEHQVAYHHSLDQAVTTTLRQPGIVVAMRPPRLEQVMAAARRGAMMPRKSTSFGPKPRMGVVLRDLRDA